MTEAPATSEFSGRIAFAVRLLRARVIAHPGTGPLAALFVPLVADYLSRRLARVLALIALWRAGKLPPPPRPRAAPPSPDASGADAASRPVLRLPQRAGWLRECLAYAWQDFALAAAFLRQAIDGDAEFRAFIAACPRAGRQLRPLWTATTMEAHPACLRLPPRSRGAPRAPHPGAPHAGTPQPGLPHPRRPKRPPGTSPPTHILRLVLPAPAQFATAPAAAAPPPPPAASPPSPSPRDRLLALAKAMAR